MIENENFIAFDFETANGKNPCSIGIAEFEKGVLINQYYSLIRPKELKFNFFTQRIHGITIEDVINEREFPDVWGDIYHFFKDRKIVAHNYGFDLSVLNHSLETYSLPKMDFDIDCSLRLSRQYLDVENHKLSTLANHFEIEQEDYHNALEDAIVCGKVYHKLITGNYPIIKRTRTRNILKTRIKNSNFIWDKSDKLSEKVFVVSGVFHQMTRNELKKAIEDNGGKVSSSISKKTSFIVAGDNMGPSKLTKAESLGISIISEQEFIDMIG
ncbi:hypothetical protein G1K82_07965 [Tenacibaculum finnmarkense]|nr:hypothetical protein [Tenacibaculum finnmarkense]SOS54125.1 conserved hypothetical protein [Tenacibaculum finnmarkense]